MTVSHQWLPSWGASVLVHAVALLVLGLIYLGTSGPQPRAKFEGSLGRLGEAIESTVVSERAGDPTAVGGDETPSLSFTPTEPAIKVINQPALPPGASLATTLSPPRISALPGLKLTDTVGGRYHIEDVSAPFAGRDPETKARLIRREGGTVASEKAVHDGLEWLARHQQPDGSWSLDYHAMCNPQGPCPDETPTPSDAAATGLGLLPMLGAGHIHTSKDSRYRENVRRGLDWLVAHQGAEGEIYTGGGINYRFYSHAIAAMALCEAYGISKDPGLKQPAQRALNFIAKNQNTSDGGWRYYPGQPGDTSVLGWQMFALRSGKLAGLEVSKRTIQGCRTFLDGVSADPARTTYTYMPGREATAIMTAEALLCRQYLGWSVDEPALRKGAGIVYRNLRESSDRNIYYWYYATQMLHNLGGKEWIAWNNQIRDGLVAMQVKGQGCDRGSWSPTLPQPDRWGVRAGRLYLTSLSILTLEVYYRWLPLYRPTDDSVDPKDAPREQARRVEPAKAAKRGR